MTYYEMLEVSESASEEVIKMAYKALVKKYHPDSFKGDSQQAESKIKEINYAFEVLSDVEKRKKYDEFLFAERNKGEHEVASNESRSKNKKSSGGEKRKFKRWLWGVLGVLLVAIVLIGVIGGTSSDDNSNSEQYEEERDDKDDDSNKIVYEPTESTGVYWLLDYRFLYYGDESRYVLLFELADESENVLSAPGEVEICIVNKNGQKVYDKTRIFTEKNFENWTFDGSRDVYVAAIYIEPNEINRGNTADGTVYFTISGSDYGFEEIKLDVYDLPYETTSGNGGDFSSSNVEDKTTCMEPLCENVVNMIGEYCAEHRCSSQYCSFGKESDALYCSSCECMELGCKNAKLNLKFYCAEHNCIVDGCSSKKDWDSDYCFFHKND